VNGIVLRGKIRNTVLGEKSIPLSLCPPRAHILWPGKETGLPRRQTGDWPPNPWHDPWSKWKHL